VLVSVWSEYYEYFVCVCWSVVVYVVGDYNDDDDDGGGGGGELNLN